METKRKGNSIHGIKVTKEKEVILIFGTGTVWYPTFEEIELLKKTMVDNLNTKLLME